MMLIWGALNWWRFGNPLESGLPPRSDSGLRKLGADRRVRTPPQSVFVRLHLLPDGGARHRGNPRILATGPLRRLADVRRCRRLFSAVRVLAELDGSAVLWTTLSRADFAGDRSTARVLDARSRVAVARTVVLLLSVLVQVPGVLVDYSKVREERAAAGETIAQDMRWSGMPLRLNARASVQAFGRAVRHLSGAEAPPRIEPFGSPAIARDDVQPRRLVDSPLLPWSDRTCRSGCHRRAHRCSRDRRVLPSALAHAEPAQMSGRIRVRSHTAWRTVALDDYLTPSMEEEAHLTANRWIKELRHANVDGDPFRRRFGIRGDSLWWFTELYLHKQQVITGIHRTLAALEAVNAAESPRQIEADSSGALNTVVNAFAQSQGIECGGLAARPESMRALARLDARSTALAIAAFASRLRPGKSSASNARRCRGIRSSRVLAIVGGER